MNERQMLVYMSLSIQLLFNVLLNVYFEIHLSDFTILSVALNSNGNVFCMRRNTTDIKMQYCNVSVDVKTRKRTGALNFYERSQNVIIYLVQRDGNTSILLMNKPKFIIAYLQKSFYSICVAACVGRYVRHQQSNSTPYDRTNDHKCFGWNVVHKLW